MTQNELTETWNKYFASKAVGMPDRKVQTKLVEHYSQLLKIIASKMHSKHHQFTADELASMATFGLYDAVANFDPTRKVKFETYAMSRLRGSVLDEIRKNDWVPRLVRSNNTKIDRARNVHESKAGRKLCDSEMAESMGISLEEFRDMSKGSACPVIHSVNDLDNENDQGKKLSIDYIEDNRTPKPNEKLLRKELFSKLMGQNFTPQERKIVWLYHFENVPMREISQTVKLSESRVSQMHADILHRLRQKAKRNPEYFSDIFTLVSEFRSVAYV